MATVLRYDLVLENVDRPHLLAAIGAAWLIGLPLSMIVGVPRARWRVGSFEDVVALSEVVMVTGAALVVVNVAVPGQLVPVSAAVGAGPMCLVLLLAGRYAARLFVAPRRYATNAGAQRLIVLGAGRAATMVVESLLTHDDAAYTPVAILDDDKRKLGRRVGNLTVAGNRTALARVARETGAEHVLIAIPSAPAPVVRELTELAAECGLTARVLPSVRELINGNVDSGDIRPVTEADLLGRRVIDTDLPSIAGYVTGRRVLVTGAGGSIGSELCRQLHRFQPEQLVLLDRDESALHAVQLSIEGRALLDAPNLVVADIRDRDRLEEIFSEHRPHVVFHAAALKHLSLLEQHPDEGLKTNVWGTQNVLEVATEYGTERLVNISTDKAANPESVLGFTKRIAERMTAATADQTGRAYLSVRFGNVLGSRGSAIPVFKAQIAAGGPVTVTDPEVTRFFMTVEEAVQLTIQAGSIGRPGDVLILDMGEPVAIVDIARRLIAASRKDVPIVFTGLRPGEKKHEHLVGEHEVAVPSSHPMIARTPVPRLHAAVLADALADVTLHHKAELRAWLAAFATSGVELERRAPLESQAAPQPAPAAARSIAARAMGLSELPLLGSPG